MPTTPPSLPARCLLCHKTLPVIHGRVKAHKTTARTSLRHEVRCDGSTQPAGPHIAHYIRWTREVKGGYEAHEKTKRAEIEAEYKDAQEKHARQLADLANDTARSKQEMDAIDAYLAAFPDVLTPSPETPEPSDSAA